MRSVLHVSEGLDGRGRPYRIVRLMTVVDCANLPGRCFVNERGEHVNRVYGRPPPRFPAYHYRREDEDE